MIPTARAETVRRVVSTRMPTRWGVFQALAFEREIANGTRRVETALALVLGDLTEGAPLLRIHSQCFTGEVLGSLRCDCNEQLEIAMRAIAAEGRGLVISEHQEPYMTGLTDDVQGPLFLRAFGVPSWAIARAFGRGPMYWYRLE